MSLATCGISWSVWVGAENHDDVERKASEVLEIGKNCWKWIQANLSQKLRQLLVSRSLDWKIITHGRNHTPTLFVEKRRDFFSY